MIGRGRKGEEAKEERADARVLIRHRPLRGPFRILDQRESYANSHLYPYRVFGSIEEGREGEGWEGGSDGGISKGSMSSIDSVGDRFIFNGCFRMARRHPN